MQLEDATGEQVERWLARIERRASTRTKALVLLPGIFKRARKLHGLPTNPATEVERPPLRRAGDIDAFSPEEVWALVRAADSEQDASPDRSLQGPEANERWYYLETDAPSTWLKVVVAYAEGRGHIVTAHARRSMP